MPWAYGDTVAMHGGGVVYATTGKTEKQVLQDVRQRIAVGEYPIGARHKAYCGIWEGHGCRCAPQLAEMRSLEGALPELPGREREKERQRRRELTRRRGRG